jgi:hypothetical protein
MSTHIRPSSSSGTRSSVSSETGIQAEIAPAFLYTGDVALGYSLRVTVRINQCCGLRPQGPLRTRFSGASFHRSASTFSFHGGTRVFPSITAPPSIPTIPRGCIGWPAISCGLPSICPDSDSTEIPDYFSTSPKVNISTTML